MKVLIMTVTAGEGHNSTAAAIEGALKEKGVECVTLDTAKKIGGGLYTIISKGYLLSTAKLKSLYAKTYASLENRKSNSYKKSLTRSMYSMVKLHIRQFIDAYDPDVIVYTHVFAGVLLDVISEKKPLRARTVGILTDFTMHPYWEEVLRTDRVVIPNELLVPAAKRKGLTDGQLLPIGIPIRQMFAASVPQAEARKELGLSPDKPTVLLMGGSMGYGTLSNAIQELDALDLDFQMICVCGRNRKAKEEIDGMKLQKKLLNYGYTDAVSLLMDASDCIVSKPGGLTTSEALAKRLPMVICNPIPGQEDRNTDFLLNNGAAMRTTKTCTLSDAIYQMFANPARVELMKKSIDCLRKPHSTADLVDAVVALGEANEKKAE